MKIYKAKWRQVFTLMHCYNILYKLLKWNDYLLTKAKRDLSINIDNDDDCYKVPFNRDTLNDGSTPKYKQEA